MAIHKLPHFAVELERIANGRDKAIQAKIF